MDTALLLTLLAILFLLLLSGFFSGSETALTAASRARLHKLAQEGDRRAMLVNRLREQKERLLGAILLGNNLVNIMASALATSLLVTLFGEVGVVYATLVMTAMVLIFSEVLPKTYALRYPVRSARFVAPLIRPVVFLLAPLVHGVDWIVRATLHLLGAHRPPTTLAHAADELRGAIELHGREAGFVKHDRAMMDSILDLDEVLVSEIMIHRKNMTMFDAGTPPSELVERLLASPHTRIPLWRDDPENIVGVLHAKDLLRAISAREGEEELDIHSITSEPWFVPETTTLREQLGAFRERHAHFALVVDEYGALMGLVTLEDILEEIVGPIADEHDITVAGVRPQPDGSFIIDGTVTIRDLNRQFDWHLPGEEASTIAGLVIHEARVIPDVGQVFIFHGFQFKVLRRQRNQITSLKVRPLQRGEA